MALVETALFARLDNYAGLVSLVGTRNYKVVLPQDAPLPANSVQRMERERFHAFGADAAWQASRFQINSWADDSDEAGLVAEQVQLALDRWRDLTSTPVVHDCFIESDFDDFDSGVGTDDDSGFRVVTEVLIFHARS